MLKSLIPALALILLANTAFAEDIILYSYTKTNQQPAEWSVIPVMASLPDTKADTLFETLKRKKLPTYGSTSYVQGTVQIDDSKCAYGSIISAEIGLTFEAYGHPQPKYMCGGKEIPSAKDALTHSATIVPLWQALSAKNIDSPSIIQVGDDYLSIQEFSKRLKSQDKSLIKAIEADFSSPNLFVKSGAMKGYIQKNFPGAEKRIARELSSGDTGNISAAMAALSNTRDPSITAQMKSVLQKKDASQENYALAMLDAADDSLRDEAIIILLKSPNDANFAKATAALDKSPKISLLQTRLDEILSNSTPKHAQDLTERLLNAHSDNALTSWLEKSDNNETTQMVAATCLKSAQDNTLRRTALSVRMQNDNPDIAFDALDLLQSDKETASLADLWQRGQKAPLPGIRHACFDHLNELSQISPRSAKGQKFIEISKSSPNDAVSQLTADAYHADKNVRQDVAYCTQWLDNAGDALRLIMYKDADESVSAMAIIQTALRPASEISLPLIKEMTARAERSANLKVAVLHALPRMINEKTVQTIATYAGNEMFDNDPAVKIASIRALSEIARRTNDPVIADNAVTSLALTVQDKSSSIVHHTLVALGKTKLPAAREIIERARTTHPESVQLALKFFDAPK